MRSIVGSSWTAACILTCAAGTGCQQQKVEGPVAEARIQQQKVERVGWVIGIKKEAIPEYKRLHANAWPEVVRLHQQAQIQNYSIYLGELEPDKYYLFGYLEYAGNDFKGDLAKLKDYPVMQKWLKITDPMQNPIPLRRQGEWWMRMEEIFRVD